MLKKEYLVFLENPRFIEWVFYPTPELDEYWNNYQEKNEQQKSVVLKSVQLCKLLYAKDKKLTAEEKHEILINALDRYYRKTKKKSYSLLISIAKYAAVAVIFYSLGYFLYNNDSSFRQQLLSKNISISANSNDGQIILSDGKNIPIKSKESSVNFSKDKVVLNKDTIHTKVDDNYDAINQVIIPYGKYSFLTLPDSSEVWLNSGSRLLFPNKFKSNKREVFLVGEAYFKVMADKTKPFIVNTNELSVEALGTEFNISSYVGDNIVNTALAEGLVKIQRINHGLFDRDIYLKPNQISSFNKTTQELSIKDVNIAYHTSWKDGFFLFENEKLNRITVRLERYYNVEIQYKNPLTGSIEICGKLILNNDFQTVIENVALTAHVTIQKINESKYLIN